LNTNLTFVYLNVTPYDSFNLEFSMLLSVNATDADGIVSTDPHLSHFDFSSLHPSSKEILSAPVTSGFAPMQNLRTFWPRFTKRGFSTYRESCVCEESFALFRALQILRGALFVSDLRRPASRQ